MGCAIFIIHIMKLRDYQLKAQHATLEAWKEVSTTLVVMPTGTGKTVLFASIIRAVYPKRVLVIAHREELIWQARDKIKAVTGFVVDVEMGEYKARVDKDMFHPKARVIVATIQTLTSGGDGAGRISKFDPKDFGAVIVDEVHHATAPAYRRAIDYFLTNPKLKVLGVTATPDRADEEALGQVFESVAFDYEILDAIKDGWLVPLEQQMVSVETLDFSKVRTQAGDLSNSDLAAVMTAEKPLHGVASATIDIIGDRRGIGFSSSVNHAQMLAEIFNRHRTGMSACVSAKTDKEERKQIISKFRDGKIQWLWNCGIFTEGFDDSGVEVISMARPTKSRALYAQMAGRATRPHGSCIAALSVSMLAFARRRIIAQSCKPSCLIIDFVGNSGKHKLMTTADILGGNISEEAITEAKAFAERHGKPVKMGQLLEDEEKKQAEIKERRLQAEARKVKLTAKATYKTQTVDPFNVLDIKPAKPRGWDDNKVLSEKQREILRKASINPDGMDYARARQLVTAVLDRWTNNKATLKQVAVMKRGGFGHECTEFTFDQARLAIDAMVKNGWNKPKDFKLPQNEAVKANEGNIPF